MHSPIDIMLEESGPGAEKRKSYFTSGIIDEIRSSDLTSSRSFAFADLCEFYNLVR